MRPSETPVEGCAISNDPSPGLRGSWPWLRTTIVGSAMFVLGAAGIGGATITVDNTTCTLVDAITAANTDTATGGCPAGSGPDTILLTGDVTLNAPHSGFDGLPPLASDITIEGGGFTVERADASGGFRLMSIASGTVTLNDIVLRNGYPYYVYEYYYYGTTYTYTFFEDGGGVRVAAPGALTLTNATVTENLGNRGGGIFNNGTLIVSDSLVTGNEGYVIGGGIESSGGSLTITDTVVSDNVAGNSGGGVTSSDEATATLTNVEISNNVANAAAGGLYNPNASMTVTNSTVSGNVSGFLGSVLSIKVDSPSGDLHLIHTTVANNSGGVYNYNEDAVVILTDSIVAGSTGTDCSTGITLAGANFDSDGTCGAAAITGLDPVLADNGGPTRTHALLSGSAAIDAAGACGLATDQRGVPRNDGLCDSGAYEFAVIQVPGPGRWGLVLAAMVLAFGLYLLPGLLRN